MNLENLNKIRAEIDKIDDEILSNLLHRSKLVDELHQIKINCKEQITDISRELAIKNRIIKLLNNPVKEKAFLSIYDTIIRELKFNNQPPNLNLNKDISDAIESKQLLIAGPCSVENSSQIEELALKISQLGIKFLRGGIFKARTKPNSFQGLGVDGLELFYNTAKKYKLYTVSEFLDIEQAQSYYEYFDVIVIGSRNMTNFEFLKKIGYLTAKNNKPVILKRGFGSTIDEFVSASQYLSNSGNENVILCLRGIRTFEQSTEFYRFTPDLHSIIELRYKSNLPVIFDPSHSAGNSDYVKDLSLAAINIGFDGLMIETHNQPEKALSDGKQAISTKQLSEIYAYLNKYRPL